MKGKQYSAVGWRQQEFSQGEEEMRNYGVLENGSV